MSLVNEPWLIATINDDAEASSTDEEGAENDESDDDDEPRLPSNHSIFRERQHRSRLMGERDLLPDVQPSEVEFLERLSQDKRRDKTVYKVKIRDTICVMKVFRGKFNVEHYLPDFLFSLFLRESRAYRLLDDKGFCARGVVPKIYGIIQAMDVELWPDLDEYEDDVPPPDAILLEYIPNMKRLGLENYSAERARRFTQILCEFHAIGLLHGDTYPRNMMVVEQESDDRGRVIWIDFDSAQIVQPGKKLLPEVEREFKGEMARVEHFETALAEDAKNGRLKRMARWYC